MTVWPALTGFCVLLGAAPLVFGLAQTAKARCQGRRGPTPFQPYWRWRKLWRKEVLVPEWSSSVFLWAPAVTAAAACLVMAMVPVSGSLPNWWPHNLLELFFLLALERFVTGLAGLDTAGTFGGLGSSRLMTLGAGVEPALLAATGILFRLSGHLLVVPMGPRLWAEPLGPLSWAMASVAFVLVALAETGRLPVDNPDTHLELTMMHEASTLEYTGSLLALNEAGSAVKLTAVLALGWVWLGPHLPSAWVDAAVTIFGVLGTAIALGWMESHLTKLRYFQVPAYLALAAGLGVLAVYLVGGGVAG